MEKRTQTRIGMEGVYVLPIPAFHCIPLQHKGSNGNTDTLHVVSGWVGHGLVLAWFEFYVLCLVCLDSSLQSPGQEKHLGILFIPLRIVVLDIQLSVET